MDCSGISKEEGLHRTRGRDLHQCHWTRERRSQDQHVFDWYTCCVRLARLSVETCGETVRTRVHAKSTPTHMAKVGDERLPFSSNTWWDGDSHGETYWHKLARRWQGSTPPTHSWASTTPRWTSSSRPALRTKWTQRNRGAQISLCPNSESHVSKLCPPVVFCRETLLALLFLTTLQWTNCEMGKDTARRQTLTRDICMRSAFLQETSTMHHPPFLPTTSRNELPRILLRKWSQKWEKRPQCFKSFLLTLGLSWTKPWETLLPSRADCRAFDKFTACKGRSLMRRKASGRWIDAEGKKRDTTRLLRQKSWDGWNWFPPILR